MKVLILLFFSIGLFAENVFFIGSFHKKKDGCVYHGKTDSGEKILIESNQICPKNKKSPRKNEWFICEVIKNENVFLQGDCKEKD